MQSIRCALLPDGPMANSGRSVRPRWKTERDLYIAVQSVEGTGMWIAMAQREKWIKKEGDSWQCAVNWVEAIPNPVRERLEQ